jgi:hypothetical protein
VSDDVYQPSGRVAWPRLILFAVIVLPVIVLLSDLAFRLDKAHYYPPFLGAVAVGTLGAILASGVVEWGKCRSVKLGRAIGVVFTLLFFLGFFQRSLIDARTRGSPEGLKGVPVSELVAGLPNYIGLRMRNFEVAPNAEQPADAHQFLVALRWGVFVMELAALVAIGWWLGGTAARRPYSERSGVWMTGRRFALPSGMGEGLLAWLEERGPLPERPKEGELTDVALLERDPKRTQEDGYLTLLAGSGRSRRFLARRRRVPAERLGELRGYLEG